MAGVIKARSLRKKPTWAEKLMWSWLRDRRFNDYKFRRQQPVGRYYLDFYCEEAHVAVELDGSGHGHPDKLHSDGERERFLVSQGIKCLRFWNHQLRTEREVVRDAIFNALQERAPHPLPGYTRPMFGADHRNSSNAPKILNQPPEIEP
jgi:very-short-patch-repair endonuclease